MQNKTLNVTLKGIGRYLDKLNRIVIPKEFIKGKNIVGYEIQGTEEELLILKPIYGKDDKRNE